MRVTRYHLRQIIRRSLNEGGPWRPASVPGHVPDLRSKTSPHPGAPRHGVDVSALTRAKPIISDWADILLDEMADSITQVANIPSEKRMKVVSMLTDDVVKSLMGSLSHYASMRKQDPPT
jgi:hypothetical protein